MVLRAPSDGVHTGKRGAENVSKGDLVYMHPGHKAEFGNLLIEYPHNSKEGVPYLTFELHN